MRAGNAAPAITAVGVTQQEGSPATLAAHIADVNDAESGPGGVTVTVDGGQRQQSMA